MLDDLLAENLTVVIDHGTRIRTAIAYNCPWYRDLCQEHGTTRKRRNIISILERLVRGKPVQGVWADRLREAAKKYDEDADSASEAEYQFLKREQGEIE